MEGAGRRRSWQEPEAHASHDPIIRLREEAVQDGTEAVFRGVPVRELARIEGAVAGAKHLAVAEHDLHAAGKAEMVEIGSIARALVERVSDHAALRRA